VRAGGRRQRPDGERSRAGARVARARRDGARDRPTCDFRAAGRRGFRL